MLSLFTDSFDTLNVSRQRSCTCDLQYLRMGSQTVRILMADIDEDY
jgi:hypothetical protein